jgi:putative transposase
MASVVQPNSIVPVAPLLHALGMSRASFYRYRARTALSEPGHISGPEAAPGSDRAPNGLDVPVPDGAADISAPRGTSCRVPDRGLSRSEQEIVRQHLYGDRFQDHTPAEMFATLLDEGTYLCSVSTMYRLLRADNATEPRSRAREHTHYARPELLATHPNQVWSWDITRLKGPRPWSYYHLYVIMDVFSRYVVGHMVAYRESHALAKQLIDEALSRQQILPHELTIHADRGSAMTSKSVALLLSDLGVSKTHSRPHVSNDNPYSEAQFRTLKYRPHFPERFGTIEHARSVVERLIDWYNGEHFHGGLALLTPVMVHYGHASAVIARRQQRLDEAYQRHPQRFVRRPPTHPAVPDAVWINPPIQHTNTGTDGNHQPHDLQ